LSSGSNAAPVATAATTKVEAKKEEVKEAPKEEEADVDMGGLFDWKW